MKRNSVFSAIFIFSLALVPHVLAQGPPPATPAAAFDPHDLSGYWDLGPDGRSVPNAVLAAGAGKATLQEMEDGDKISERWCRPLGIPAAMDSGRPIAITQGRWETMINFEANSSPRHIYFRREHVNPDIFDPSSVGDSIGNWEGDTFVVETIGFHDKNGRMMIPGGGFRTTKSKLVERFKLIRNGQMLSVTTTWTEPSVYQTPHTYEFRYTRIPGNYEPRPAVGCDPWDEERAAYVERTFSPALKKAAEAAVVKPGTEVSVKTGK
ncbi:MAG: hypothetical protein ABL995_01015 [Bryobacteraceae bacterium]